MKRILVLLLAMAMLLTSVAVLAEGSDAITMELKTAKLPLYAADDPYLEGLTAAGDGLQVIVLSVKKGVQLQVTVQPKSVKNKQVTLSVDNEGVARAKGNTVTGVAPGEAVLTIASKQDPSVTLQYRIVVVQPVTRLTVTAPAKTVAVGSTMQLTPVYTPDNATRKGVTWTSANEQIATVDANGVVTGQKRGNTRITAVATDGSKIRANVNVQVTQGAQEIQLDKAELTVDAGKSGVLKATVLPKDANNKNVVWSSSDESVAKVNGQGRVTGVALGDCEIICTSKDTGDVQAKAVVHVQQPVKKIIFGDAPSVYNGESAQLSWTVDPANASHPELEFSSSNTKILTVDENGLVTGVMGGDASVIAKTTDGSNRQAKLKIRVMQHVTGVHMKRHVAYVDLNATSPTTAILEPEKAKYINRNMTWESADPSIATVVPEKKNPNRADIHGNNQGETTVTGTTEDGGFQASIVVKVGDWQHCLKLTDAEVRGEWPFVTVKNVSDLYITSITCEFTVYDINDQVIPSNLKDPSKPSRIVYNRPLNPGASTEERYWKVIDFTPSDNALVAYYVIKVVEYQIDNDWVKTIQPRNQPTKKCPVHL